MVELTQLSPNQNSGFTLRPAAERGHVDMGWLQARHSFSFGEYFDRHHMHFANLRVINDDRIAGGAGFPMHPHDNFEIFSYLLEGALAHKDSMGNGSVVSAGGVQYMSAGAGVRHSEFNPSQSDETRLLQIWLKPNAKDGAPRYETMDIDPADKDGNLKLFLSGDGRDGSMHIKADADIYAATLNAGQSIGFGMSPSKQVWIQMARGALTVNDVHLSEGDGLAITEAQTLNIADGKDAEFLLFELG